MDAEEFARICLDPVRLAALGRSVDGTLTVDALCDALGVTRREALEAVGELRLSELIDEDGKLLSRTLHTVAGTLSKRPGASPEITDGEWSDTETRVLEIFFSGDRLREIPTQRRKRRIVLERLAQDFDPGARYDERTVSEQLRIYHEDYAALRRYLVDEGILTRADGVYWRTGGRVPVDTGPLSMLAPGEDEESPPVELETERNDVKLVSLTRANAGELAAAAGDVRIARFMADSFPYPYTIDDAARWITKVRDDDPPLHLGVFVDGALAGGVGCYLKSDSNTGSAEIGWWLNPRWWGRGIATTAVRRFIDYCFDELDLHRVEAGVFLTDPASARVADKCGLMVEGIARDAYVKDGVLIDRLSYGLARADDRGR